MGHTKIPFTFQFQRERMVFTEFRRALLLKEDQLLLEDLWDRAEFHIPAAEKGAHPLALEILARVPRERPLSGSLAEIVALAHTNLAALHAGRVPLADLVVTQKLSREPDEYRGVSASAVAARQLRAAGKTVPVGQRVPFLYVKGRPPAVRAWGLPFPPALAELDHTRYQRLLAGALHGLLVPLGLEEFEVQSLLAGGLRQLSLWSLPDAELPRKNDTWP